MSSVYTHMDIHAIVSLLHTTFTYVFFVPHAERQSSACKHTCGELEHSIYVHGMQLVYTVYAMKHTGTTTQWR